MQGHNRVNTTIDTRTRSVSTSPWTWWPRPRWRCTTGRGTCGVGWNPSSTFLRHLKKCSKLLYYILTHQTQSCNIDHSITPKRVHALKLKLSYNIIMISFYIFHYCAHNLEQCWVVFPLELIKNLTQLIQVAFLIENVVLEDLLCLTARIGQLSHNFHNARECVLIDRSEAQLIVIRLLILC